MLISTLKEITQTLYAEKYIEQLENLPFRVLKRQKILDPVLPKDKHVKTTTKVRVCFQMHRTLFAVTNSAEKNHRHHVFVRSSFFMYFQ